MKHARAENLIVQQWHGYAQFHRSRANLYIHIVAVPVFVAGNVALIYGLVRGNWILAAAAAVATGASLFAQGRGHRLETTPAAPFTGPLNAVARIFAEQWLTFPCFVLAGRWATAVRKTRVKLR